MHGIVVLFLIACAAVAGYTTKQWLDGRLSPLKDHSKKQEELTAENVQIVVDNDSKRARTALNEKRKPALPKLSRQELGSPVGKMEASIRSALRELRSRQYVKSICSKFESRLVKPISTDDEESEIATQTPMERTSGSLFQNASKQERSSTEGSVPMQRTTGARSNNLNAFLRRYSSNLERAVFASPEELTSTTSPSSSNILPSPPAITSVEESPSLARTPLLPSGDAVTQMQHPVEPEWILNLELDLQLSSAYSNQCESPPRAENCNASVPLLITATDCDQPSKEEPHDDSEQTKENFSLRPSEEAIPATILASNIPSFSRIPAPKSSFSLRKSEPQSANQVQLRDQCSMSINASLPRKNINLERFQQQFPANRAIE